MSESSQQTFLTSVADNIADNFFGDSAGSHAITAKEPEKKDGKLKNEGIQNLSKSLSAADLIDDILEKPDEDPIIIEDEVKQPVNQPTLAKKESPYSFLIEKNVLGGFEDDSPINTPEDLEKLIIGNKQAWVEEAKAEAIKEHEETIPEEIKIVVDYARNGGKDFKTLFSLLSSNQEIRSYDAEKPEDQRSIVRKYYGAQGWTEDEVEDEVVRLVEAEQLTAQAKKLKPMLDRINNQMIADQTEQQAQIDEQKKRAEVFFNNKVIEALKPGKLGDVKISKEEQQDLYNALVKESYQSFSGKTNRLGALLDKIQYIEPNYELLMEVTMLLSDPDGFKKKIRENINTEVAAQTVKKIKIDQTKQKIGSSYNAEKDTKNLPKLRSGFINPFE